MNLQNIYTFTYQKTLLHMLLLLPFKIVESLQCVRKGTAHNTLQNIWNNVERSRKTGQ